MAAAFLMPILPSRLRRAACPRPKYFPLAALQEQRCHEPRLRVSRFPRSTTGRFSRRHHRAKLGITSAGNYFYFFFFAWRAPGCGFRKDIPPTRDGIIGRQFRRGCLGSRSRHVARSTSVNPFLGGQNRTPISLALTKGLRCLIGPRPAHRQRGALRHQPLRFWCPKSPPRACDRSGRSGNPIVRSHAPNPEFGESRAYRGVAEEGCGHALADASTDQGGRRAHNPHPFHLVRQPLF